MHVCTVYTQLTSGLEHSNNNDPFTEGVSDNNYILFQ